MSAARTNAAFESPDVQLRGPLDVEARFNLRNTSGDSWRPGRGIRRRIPHLRFRQRDVGGGWRTPGAARRCRTRRLRAGGSALRAAARIGPLRRIHLTHARGCLLVLHAGLAVLARAGDCRRRARAPGTSARGDPAHHSPRESAARRRPGFHAAHRYHRAQPQPDPHHGPPRYSGPLPRLIWRRLLDHSEPAAADADLLLRIRHGAARALRHRSQPRRLRSLFPRRNAAVAGRSAKRPDARLQ